MEIAIEIFLACVMGWLLGNWIYPHKMIGGVIGGLAGFAAVMFNLYRRLAPKDDDKPISPPPEETDEQS